MGTETLDPTETVSDVVSVGLESSAATTVMLTGQGTVWLVAAVECCEEVGAGGLEKSFGGEEGDI